MGPRPEAPSSTIIIIINASNFTTIHGTMKTEEEPPTISTSKPEESAQALKDESDKSKEVTQTNDKDQDKDKAKDEESSSEESSKKGESTNARRISQPSAVDVR
jgi:hypothetical protein